MVAARTQLPSRVTAAADVAATRSKDQATSRVTSPIALFGTGPLRLAIVLPAPSWKPGMMGTIPLHAPVIDAPMIATEKGSGGPTSVVGGDGSGSPTVVVVVVGTSVVLLVLQVINHLPA